MNSPTKLKYALHAEKPRNEHEWIWIIRDSDLSLTDKAIMWAICSRLPSSCAGYDKIASDAGCKRRAVISHVKHLSDIGWLKVEHRFYGGGEDGKQETNVYAPCLPENITVLYDGHKHYVGI